MIIFLNITLSPEATFIIGYSILPLFILCWLTAFTDLLYKKGQKVVLIIFLILSIIFEIIFFFLLFTESSQIGTFIRPFQIRWSLFMEIFLFSFIIIVIITGVLFARASIKSSNPEVKLKGKFILFAFVSFTVGAVIEALFHLEPITVVITRTILISSAIEFYFGLILPNWLKKIFLKVE